MGRRGQIAGMAGCIALMVPASALGSSAAVKRVCTDAGTPFERCETGLVFQAGPGEVNDLVVSRAAGSVVFEEFGSVITAGPGCTAVTSTTVACARTAATRFPLVRLAGGDDSASVRMGGVTVEGGAGRDTLRATAGGSTLVGGASADRLVGSPGSDELFGSGGADRLSGAGGDDALDGGRGRDVLLGGRGRDDLRADDSERDTVDCGKGRRDFAATDDRDRRTACERRPRG